MQRFVRNLVVAAALVTAIVFGVRQLSQDSHLHARLSAQSMGISQISIWSHGPDGSLANAHEHWLKHGDEFPEFHREQDYEAGALAFVTHPPSSALIKHNARGDTLFYDPATNTFAVRDDHGEPRTFFRPDNGRAYWDRQ